MFFLAVLCAAGDPLDDAVSLWAKKISSHLAADEIAHITWNNAATPDADSATYLARARTLLARALQRRLKNPKPVEVTATFSQNLKDYLLIAAMHRENDKVVEITTVPRALAAVVATAAFRLERRLLWDQEAPILDVAVSAGQMLVLDTTGVSRYEQQDSKWRKVESIALDIPPIRDPRGRLTMTETSLLAEVPGMTCAGTWRPAVALECQQGGRFTAGRNTIEEAGRPAYFAYAEIGSDHIIAASDGRTYIYDLAGKQLSASDLWEDFAAVSSTCTGVKIVAADSARNTLAIFELANHNPVRVSDSTEVPGAVTALWPAGSAALVVVRNRSTNRYEAYRIGVVCDR